MEQTSFLKGEEELRRLREERNELKSSIKPLLDLVKGNAQFLTKYAPFCHDVFYRSGHLEAAKNNTAIAIDQADELREATQNLGEKLLEFERIEKRIEALKVELNESTNGEFQREHPDLYGTSIDQLEEQADELLEAAGLDAETAQPEEFDEDGEFDPATAI